MSIFASKTQSNPIPIPFDPPHTVTVRKLTGREIEAAQEAHRSSIASVRARSWAAMFRRMLQNGATDPQVIQALADPLTGFDRHELVFTGLVSWTYSERVIVRTDPENHASDRAERRAHVDDLDDEAVDFIATEILRLTKPGLFVGAETETKNGDGSSTST